MLHVALYQPQIPPNTGNIARHCVGVDAMLHLIGPFAFDISSKAVRRAGLDYWEHLNLQTHESPDDFVDWLDGREPWLVTKFGVHRYDQPAYAQDDVLLFGSELTGLPDAWLKRWQHRTVYLPILGHIRSFNLANTASIVLSHACLVAGVYDTFPANRPEVIDTKLDSIS